MQAKIRSYYDDDRRSQRADCPNCDWSGLAAEMDSEIYRELTEFSCPTCDQILFVVAHPTLGEIERAAGRGDEEAIQHLALIRRVEASKDKSEE